MESSYEARLMVLDTVKDWDRSEAEKRFSDVLDGAKDGRLQRIADADGVFEVKFRAAKTTRAGDVLARGGPGTE
jgi:hypothetical protein